MNPKHNGRMPGIRNQNAFTLLEVIVAMAILAIALTTLFGSQSQSLSLATEARFNTNASLLARSKLAQLQSGKLEPVNAQGDFGEEFPGYSWNLEVQDTPSFPEKTWSELFGDEPVDGLKRADLTVSWGNDRYRYTVRYYFEVRKVQ